MTLEPVFRQFLIDSRLIAVENVPGDLQEAVFTMVLKSRVTPQVLLDAVRGVDDQQKAVLVVGQQEVDL